MFREFCAFYFRSFHLKRPKVCSLEMYVDAIWMQPAKSAELFFER